MRKEKILVIGAGMAGLACAKNLHERGHKVLVLEARNRLGGRIWTDRSLGMPLELGASAIHDIRRNPLMKLVRKYRLPYVTADYGNAALYDWSGSRFRNSRVKSTVKRYDSILKEAVRKACRQGDEDTLLRAFQEELRPQHFKAQKQRLISWIQASYEIVSGADFENLSARSYDETEVLESRSAFLPWGLDLLVDRIGEGLGVRFKEKVVRIDVHPRGVTVIADKARYRADRVVVTLPLGVLKREAVVFSPALPLEKRKIIQKLGMGLLNKAALIFSENMAYEKKDFLGYASRTRGEWPRFVSYFHKRKLPALVGMQAGKRALQEEAFTDEETTGRLVRILRRILHPGVPWPSAVRVTRWSRDPFARGSYSYLPPGTTRADFEILAKPVGTRLFFAGEATEPAHFATIHGAYLSGLREAARICELAVS